MTFAWEEVKHQNDAECTVSRVEIEGTGRDGARGVFRLV